MHEPLELTFPSPDGVIDCRLEPEENDGEIVYAATILYPHTVNGFSRSEVYCHRLLRTKSGNYMFDANEDILPKIKILEAGISEALNSF